MRFVFAALAGFLLLSACAETRYAGEHVSDTARQEAQLTKYKLKYIFDPDRRIVNEPPRPIEPAYCYRNFGDIVCYKDPLPNARSRLVGYQEPLESVPDVISETGYKAVEYRDGDRSRIWNPYRSDSNRIDVTTDYPNSKNRNVHPVEGSNLYVVDSAEPVVVHDAPPMRDYHADAPKPAKKKAVKKAGKKKSKAKSTGCQCDKPVKKAAKKSSGKVAAKKASEKAPEKTSDKKEGTEGSSNDVRPAGATDASAMRDAEKAGKPVTSVASAANTAIAEAKAEQAPAPTVKKETASAAVAPASTPAVASPSSAGSQVATPSQTGTNPRIKPNKELEEIKYDKNAADPKSLIKKRD